MSRVAGGAGVYVTVVVKLIIPECNGQVGPFLHVAAGHVAPGGRIVSR